jgi:lysophospholipase L1-like esterase
MTQVSTLLLLLLWLGARDQASAQTAVATDPAFARAYYAQRLAFFRLMPDQKKEIVFLGDGLVEFGEWQELLPGRLVINRGISGDNSYGVLARLDEVLSSRPDRIFLQVGAQDLLMGLSEEIILRNYARIVSQISQQSPKTRIVILSLLPVNEPMLPPAYRGLTNAGIRSLNQALRRFAEVRRLGFADLYEPLSGPDGQLRPELSLDGFHITASAYLDWIEALRMAKVLR